MQKNILHLTLHREWFEKIAAGKKCREYRAATPYWQSRLEGKSFDEVHFRNGYSKDKPFLRARFVGISKCRGHFVIHLGKILEIKNY